MTITLSTRRLVIDLNRLSRKLRDKGAIDATAREELTLLCNQIRAAERTDSVGRLRDVGTVDSAPVEWDLIDRMRREAAAVEAELCSLSATEVTPDEIRGLRELLISAATAVYEVDAAEMRQQKRRSGFANESLRS